MSNVQRIHMNNLRTGLLCLSAATLLAQPPTLKLTTILAKSASGLAAGSGGVLYGTSSPGGPATVFSLTPPASASGSWTETVLYTFAGAAEGTTLNPAVTGGDGILYGTTVDGGAAGAGTVYSLTPPVSPNDPWTENVLYSFSGSDGDNPIGGLLIGSGPGGRPVIYGTTSTGGTAGGFGVVFSLAETAPGVWTETVLHSFAGGNDGEDPNALAMDAKGLLYGATEGGGVIGKGTVFSLAPPATSGNPWTHTVLHNFPSSAADGFFPAGIAIGPGTGENAVVYGVTEDGGTSQGGVAFSLTPPVNAGGPWTETIIHEFGNGITSTDGSSPDSLVIAGDGVLVGSTSIGGNNGVGTVFWLAPPAEPGGEWSEALFRFPAAGHKGDIPAFVILGDHVVYGSTELGGPAGEGTIFSLQP